VKVDVEIESDLNLWISVTAPVRAVLRENSATLSVIRRAPQLGQNPGRLQLKTTRCPAWQLSQRTRREPLLKPPALEVILELLLGIPRQFAALVRQVGLERGIAVLDKLVKEVPFRAVGLIASCASSPNWLPCQPVTAT
jgi:hypothetical protein